VKKPKPQRFLKTSEVLHEFENSACLTEKDIVYLVKSK